MKDLKVFSCLLSANARKVQAVCYELEIDVSIEEVNVYAGEGQDLEYLAINPLGQIPTLIDGSTILRESNSIAVYLSEKYGNMTLYGSTPERRAEINQWLFWESSQWQPVLTSVMGQYVGHRLLPEIIPAPQSKLDWNMEQCVKQLNYLENTLSNEEWLVNQELSLADYSVAAMTTYFGVCGFPDKSYPNISAWLDRVSELEAWRKTEHPLWC